MTTLTARKRPNSAVRHLMFAQVCQLLEPLLTSMAPLAQLDAMVGFLASVNSLVSDQVALLVKIFLTDLTLVVAPPRLLWSSLLSDFQKVVKLLLEKRDGKRLSCCSNNNQVT